MAIVRIAAFSISIDGYGAGPGQNLENPHGVRGFDLHSMGYTCVEHRSSELAMHVVLRREGEIVQP